MAGLVRRVDWKMRSNTKAEKAALRAWLNEFLITFAFAFRKVPPPSLQSCGHKLSCYAILLRIKHSVFRFLPDTPKIKFLFATLPSPSRPLPNSPLTKMYKRWDNGIKVLCAFSSLSVVYFVLNWMNNLLFLSEEGEQGRGERQKKGKWLEVNEACETIFNTRKKKRSNCRGTQGLHLLLVMCFSLPPSSASPQKSCVHEGSPICLGMTHASVYVWGLKEFSEKFLVVVDVDGKRKLERHR